MHLLNLLAFINLRSRRIVSNSLRIIYFDMSLTVLNFSIEASLSKLLVIHNSMNESLQTFFNFLERLQKILTILTIEMEKNTIVSMTLIFIS